MILASHLGDHKATPPVILSPIAGSNALILATEVTSFQLKERDSSLRLPGALTMKEHPGSGHTGKGPAQCRLFPTPGPLLSPLLPPSASHFLCGSFQI